MVIACRFVNIVKSPLVPAGQVAYAITARGLEEVRKVND